MPDGQGPERMILGTVVVTKVYNLHVLSLTNVNIVTYGAFPLHGTVRLSSARFAFPLQFSTAIEWAGLFTCRYSCAASTAWHHRKRATNKLTTKKGDGIVFFTLGMWMFLTAMERSMRMLVIYPQQQRLWWQWPRAVDEESRDVRAGVLRYLS